MASTSQTALGPHGYCFQMPPMGLPDLAGDWVPLRAAVGPRKACYEQLLVRHIPAPLRQQDDSPSSRGFDLEYNGWIWVLPMLPSRVSPGEVDLFTVVVRRDKKSSLPAGQQVARIRDNVFAIFARHSPEEINCLAEPEGDSDSSYMDTMEILRLCRDPAPAQCQPTQEQRLHWMRTGQDDVAHKAWPAMSPSFATEAWTREVNRQAIAAGLNKTNEYRTETYHRLRPREEPDQEGRGLEYALRDPDDDSPPRPQDWRPVPAYAFPADYVRCGVNLRRLLAHKKLLTKVEWPTEGAAAHQQAEGGMKE